MSFPKLSKNICEPLSTISFSNEILTQTKLIATQLLVYQSLDGDKADVRATFLDISEAFDEVWHQGLIYKLKQSGKLGDFLNTTIDFLSLRKQPVILNWQVS